MSTHLELDPNLFPGQDPLPAPRLRWLRWVVVLLLLVTGATLYVLNRPDAQRAAQYAIDSEESLKRVKKNLQAFPDYDKSKAYYDSLADSAHPAAFDAAYDFKTNKANETKYFAALFESMSQQAQKDKRDDVLRPINILLDVLKARAARAAKH